MALLGRPRALLLIYACLPKPHEVLIDLAVVLRPVPRGAGYRRAAALGQQVVDLADARSALDIFLAAARLPLRPTLRVLALWTVQSERDGERSATYGAGVQPTPDPALLSIPREKEPRREHPPQEIL